MGTSDLSNVKASQLKSDKESANQGDDSNFVILVDGILIDGKFYSPEDFEDYLKSAEIVLLDDGYNSNGSSVQPFFALLLPFILFLV